MLFVLRAAAAAAEELVVETGLCSEMLVSEVPDVSEVVVACESVDASDVLLHLTSACRRLEI